MKNLFEILHTIKLLGENRMPSKMSKYFKAIPLIREHHVPVQFWFVWRFFWVIHKEGSLIILLLLWPEIQISPMTLFWVCGL